MRSIFKRCSCIMIDTTPFWSSRTAKIRLGGSRLRSMHETRRWSGSGNLSGRTPAMNARNRWSLIPTRGLRPVCTVVRVLGLMIDPVVDRAALGMCDGWGLHRPPPLPGISLH